jgi:hypothetical protein
MLPAIAAAPGSTLATALQSVPADGDMSMSSKMKTLEDGCD